MKFYFVNILSSLLIFTTLLLHGCVTTAVIVSTAVVSVKASIDPRTIGTQIDDNLLEFRINRILSKDERIRKKTRIRAIVYRGKVLLIGQSPSAKLISYTKQVVAKIAGVAEIYNEIRKSKPLSFRDISLDTWITLKIRSHLLSNTQVQSSNIKVISENGEIFLLGLVTKTEEQEIVNIASYVTGVKHIIIAFDYIQ